MTKPVYYQVEQRVCGAWSPTKTGKIIVLSGSFRELLDTVKVNEYQRIKRLDQNKLAKGWTPNHIYSKQLRRILAHQRVLGKLSWWRRLLRRPVSHIYLRVSDEMTYSHVCHSLAEEQAVYLQLFQQLYAAGNYRSLPDYLIGWRDAARFGCADAACRLLVCRSEQGHKAEFLEVWWSGDDE